MFKRSLLLAVLFLIGLSLPAQTLFKVIYPQKKVFVNEPFQIQYVIEDPENEAVFDPPAFTNLEIISGPNIYNGSIYGEEGAVKITNIVYTLVASKAGDYLIKPAKAKFKLTQLLSNSFTVYVSNEKTIPATEKNEALFLNPGEDPYKKIKENLFVKVFVDKKQCYVGEPVTAVFKLYSRLDSRSDVVKSPGFYGFSIYDVASLNDRDITTENINGKSFDVHTIRKVQLYPLQAGTYEIDPMKFNNQVVFSSKRERLTQQIMEDVLFERKKGDKGFYEVDLETPAVPVVVFALPETNQPADFNGGVGNFSIETSLDKSVLKQEEKALYTVTVSGKGNFSQLITPVISWPDSIEIFGPKVIDELVAVKEELSGKKIFQYTLVGIKPGAFSLPEIKFSFFDPQKKQYETLYTKPVEVTVTNEKVTVVPITSSAKKSQPFIFIAALITVLFTAVFFFTLQRKKRSNKKEIPNPVIPTVKKTAEEIIISFQHPDFFNELKNIFLEETNELLHSNIKNSYGLQKYLEQKEINPTLIEKAIFIVSSCEKAGYSPITAESDKKELLKNANDFLKELEIKINN